MNPLQQIPWTLVEHLSAIAGVAAAAQLFVFFLYGGLANGRFARAGALALIAGFLAGFAMAFGKPTPLLQAWVYTVVTAAIAGAILAVGNGLNALLRTVLTLVAVAATTFVFVQKTMTPTWEYMAAIAGLQIAYLLATLETVREPKLWLAGPVVWWMMAATMAGIASAIIDATTGTQLVIMSVMAALMGLVGILKRTRTGVRGGMGFFALQMPVLLALTYFNNPTNADGTGPALPMSMYALLAAAPLSLLVTWVPSVKKRAWVAILLSVVVAAIPLAIAVVLAIHYRPPGDLE